MSKKIICITTVIVIMFVSFTGCSVKGTKRDLSSLAIVIGLAIDKNEGDSQGFETFGDEQARILMTAQDSKEARGKALILPVKVMWVNHTGMWRLWAVIYWRQSGQRLMLQTGASIWLRIKW